MAQQNSKSTARNASPKRGQKPFHNPYNFVPAPSRQNVKGELGDRPPVGHSQYLPDHWSGRIQVTLTTTTPLLIPDASQAQTCRENAEHQTFPLRLVDGKPYLPPTSIKGALRSAYEAITNSRFSVFAKHNTELAYRMKPDIRIKPARLVGNAKTGKLSLRLMESVKLECYDKYNKNSKPSPDKGASAIAKARNYPDHQIPKHGALLWVQVSNHEATHIQIRHRDEKEKKGWKKGWGCVTGAGCDGARYERVFILPSDDESEVINIQQSEIDLWEKLIADYRAIHESDRENRKKNNRAETEYLGHEPGETAWSRHILSTSKHDTEFKPGTLCYVLLNSQNKRKVESIIPVTISRQLFKTSPASLLAESLKPSTKIEELSPADRVFGWVNQSGNGSYRGQLRIPSVRCLTESDQAIEYFTLPNQDPQTHPGLPLTILGEPKPQQARFYVAKDQSGTPLDNGIAKEKAYQPQNGLRGRKVYPHHKTIANTPGYWNNPMSDRTQESIKECYQEYRRPRDKDRKEQRDSQNRSIQAWVPHGTQFQFDIDIINLSAIELGALLWLLQLPDDHHHRIGGGKPLGFGSAKLSVNWAATDLRTGQDWATYYQSLTPIAPPSPQPAKDCIALYETAIAQAYGKESRSFTDVQFIQSFLQSAKGLDHPIHYPRVTNKPTSDGENFQWFTQNESEEKRSLPPLWKETGLLKGAD